MRLIESGRTKNPAHFFVQTADPTLAGVAPCRHLAGTTNDDRHDPATLLPQKRKSFLAPPLAPFGCPDRVARLHRKKNRAHVDFRLTADFEAR